MNLRLAYAQWQAAEWRALASAGLRGQLHEGPYRAQLQEALSACFAPSEVLLCNAAHLALAAALRLFSRQRPAAREVLVPALICPSVLRAIESAGLIWRALDIDGQLNLSPTALARTLDAHTLAVVAPHMYACPAAILAIETLCRQAGVYLIDDAAQVCGVRVAGRMLGSFGDLGLLSFAQSKTLVTGIRGSGAALLINQPSWRLDLLDWHARLPPAHGRLGPMLDFLWNYQAEALSRHSRYYFRRLFPSAPVAACSASLPGDAECRLACTQLARLDTLLAARRATLDHYAQALADFPELDLPQWAAGRYLARLMLTLPDGTDRAAVRRTLAKHGIATRLPYALAHSTGIELPRAERLLPRLIELPLAPHLNRETARQVLQYVRHACAPATAAAHRPV